MELTTAFTIEHLSCQLMQANLIRHLTICWVIYDAPRQSKRLMLCAEGVPIQTIFCQSLRNLP